MKKTKLVFILIAAHLLCFGVSASAADITGIVKFEGEVPTMRPIQMSGDPDCMSKHQSPPVAESLVLGDGNTMANVLVEVRGVPEKEYPVPTDAASITQHGCVYSPHVLGVRAGQKIKFLNEDGILHNVHALPDKNREFNLGMPAAMKEAEREFAKPEGPFALKCDVHPWMGAHIAVFEHPFFAVTDKDGKFEIKDLPPGEYEVVAWHEKLQSKSMKVKVTEQGADPIEFVYTRPGS